MNTTLFDQVRQLSVEDQIELVEALWDNIVERNAAPGPAEAQKAELARRLSEHAANPDDVVPWSEVKDSALRFPSSALILVVGGLLVGFGTRLGFSCTSGHAVCGVSRLSPRSLVATAVFMATAVITVAVMHALGLAW
jgi:putative addiction module component (TIGR02574 family)